MFRIITGSIVLIIGIGFLGLALQASLVFLIHGGVLLAIGIAILLNRQEDDIEQIKNTNEHYDRNHN